MDAGQQALKKSSMIALSALAALLLLGVIYFKEKVFFADASYVLFDILNYKFMDIQFNRYGSFITQLVPYLCMKLHIPVRIALVGYAAGFQVFYLGVASLLVFRFRQYGLAILMALFYTLFVSDSFFWISEIPQGIGWMFLLFGITINAGERQMKFGYLIIPFLLLAFLTIFTHFVIIIPTLFLWVYFMIGQKNWPWSRKYTIVLSCMLAAIIGLKFVIALSGTGSGDGPHLRGVTHVSFKDIFQSFSTPVVKMFSGRCLNIYWTGIPVLILGIYGMIKTGQRKLAIWPLLSCIGYIIIMGLTYGGEDEHVQLFHIESEWMCIAIIVAAPFVFDFLPGLKPRLGLSLLALVFLARLVYIGNTLPTFRWRIHFQERVLAQMKKKGITKLAIYREPEINPKYMVDWAAGYESTLMSAMDGEQPQRSFIFVTRDEDPKKLEKLAKPTAIFLWDIVDPYNLNKDYFSYDLTTPYQVMSYNELMK